MSNAADLDTSLFVNLECRECGLAYSVYAPKLDEIEFPVCGTCRNKPARPEDGCEQVGGLADA